MQRRVARVTAAIQPVFSPFFTLFQRWPAAALQECRPRFPGCPANLQGLTTLFFEEGLHSSRVNGFSVRTSSDEIVAPHREGHGKAASCGRAAGAEGAESRGFVRVLLPAPSRTSGILLRGVRWRALSRLGRSSRDPRAFCLQPATTLTRKSCSIDATRRGLGAAPSPTLPIWVREMDHALHAATSSFTSNLHRVSTVCWPYFSSLSCFFTVALPETTCPGS